LKSRYGRYITDKEIGLKEEEKDDEWNLEEITGVDKIV
jgi:hypothetical protein